MKIIQPSFEILSYTSDMTKLIERAIRCAYKSEDRIEEGSDAKIISHIKSLKHESTLEHGSITVKFVTDRGVTHELVRHRICSFTQESTRYCNYGKGKFGSEITVIEPFFFNAEERRANSAQWLSAMNMCEMYYLAMLKNGATPQEARSVLPNSLKTEIVVTANVREWRKIFELRTSKEAHPQIRQIMCPLLAVFRQRWPLLFDDIGQIDHECPAYDSTTSVMDPKPKLESCEFNDNDWRHPSIIPDEEGDYELCGWYGDHRIGNWKRGSTKYGIWTINGREVDRVAISLFKFKNK